MDNPTTHPIPTSEELKAELLAMPEPPEQPDPIDEPGFEELVAVALRHVRGRRGGDLVCVILVGSSVRRAITTHSDIDLIALAFACDALRRLRGSGTRVIAVDLPTGVSADDGAAGAHAVHADLTVTFGCLKRGHVLHPGRDLSGTLDLVDIGLLPPDRAGIAGVALSTSAEMAALWSCSLPGVRAISSIVAIAWSPGIAARKRSASPRTLMSGSFLAAPMTRFIASASVRRPSR